MSCYSKEELEQMLEDVVNALDLSEAALAQHGPLGTTPAELVKEVLVEKNRTIQMFGARVEALKSKAAPKIVVKKSKVKSISLCQSCTKRHTCICGRGLVVAKCMEYQSHL